MLPVIRLEPEGLRSRFTDGAEADSGSVGSGIVVQLCVLDPVSNPAGDNAAAKYRQRRMHHPWPAVLRSKDWNGCDVPAALYAFDAANVSHRLYSSEQNIADRAGAALRFNMPTVINGHVYVGAKHEVDVYGLLPKPRPISLAASSWAEDAAGPRQGARVPHIHRP